MTKERIEKLLKAGANVVLTTKGIDDMALKVGFIYIDQQFSLLESNSTWEKTLFYVKKCKACQCWSGGCLGYVQTNFQGNIVLVFVTC